MPELPEVETVRRGLEPVVAGSVIEAVELTRPDLRFPFPENFAERLGGHRIVRLGRRAKYLLFALDSGETLLSHLGMTGNYRFRDAGIDQPSRLYNNKDNSKDTGRHDHVLMRLRPETGAAVTLIYSDPRRFGFMDIFADENDCAYLAGLGPEPLGNALSADHLAARFAGRRSPVKAALLDQRNVAGLGNIYVCEALWRAGISPLTPAGRLVDTNGRPRPGLDLLVTAIRDVLTAAIAAGGSTLKDFRNTDGAAGYFQHAFDVYDHAGDACRRPGCGGEVLRIVQSGRSSFYCPACQPEIS